MSESAILVWGAGGHGQVVAEAARLAGHNVVGFIDAAFDRVNTVIDAIGTRIVVSEQDFLSLLNRRGKLPAGATAVALGIGDNEIRLRCAKALGQLCAPAIVHPAATVSESVSLGSGTVVLAGSILNVKAAAGIAAIINTGAIVEHDCVLADGVHISPGAVLAGGVTVGKCAWIGAGATIIPKVHVGEHTIIGAGTVVLRPVARGTTVVGNPARVLDKD